MSVETGSLEKIKQLFQRILPLVDDVADALGVLLLCSALAAAWIFVYFFYLQKYSLAVSLVAGGVSFFPILILLRIWFALENLKDIPKIAGEIMEDVSDEVAQSWHGIKSGKKGAMNVLGQARKLFEIRSMLKSADDIFEQYFSIGPLINPFYLLLGVLSLIALFFVFVTGALLGIMSII